MTSRGTMEREDDLPASLSRLKDASPSEVRVKVTSKTSVTSARPHEDDAEITDFLSSSASGGMANYRERLSVRPELEADLGSNNGSEIMNESVVSSLTDR